MFISRYFVQLYLKNVEKYRQDALFLYYKNLFYVYTIMIELFKNKMPNSFYPLLNLFFTNYLIEYLLLSPKQKIIVVFAL